MRTSACECMSACASVFTVMNSTPCTPSTTMRSTAFEPPPPHPITLINACGSGVLLKPLKSAIGRLLDKLGYRLQVTGTRFQVQGRVPYPLSPVPCCLRQEFPEPALEAIIG